MVNRNGVNSPTFFREDASPTIFCYNITNFALTEEDPLMWQFFFQLSPFTHFWCDGTRPLCKLVNHSCCSLIQLRQFSRTDVGLYLCVLFASGVYSTGVGLYFWDWTRPLSWFGLCDHMASPAILFLTTSLSERR